MSEIFVFGSNTEGRHGAGAAKAAREQHGAIYGRGEGLQGQSYAIPTKGTRLDAPGRLKTLPLDAIAAHVATFIRFAESRPDLTFRLTPIGCGLAGYKPYQIAPMFARAPSNIVMPDEFESITLGEGSHD